jgi:isopenicillin N synthase-like dioxygenase
MAINIAERLPQPHASVVGAIDSGTALPLLNLGAFIAGEPGAAEQLAADVKLIQERLGFYMIVNYGFDPELIEDAYEQSVKLFALPDEVNRPFEFRDHMQGYWPPRAIVNLRPGYENEAQASKGSKLAGWTFLRERRAGDPKVISNMRHRAMNKWPDPKFMPRFRDIVGRYHAEMVGLGLKLVKVYALALGLSADYFDRDFEDLEWYSRINFAPKPDAGDSLAITAHSDHSFLTLLPIAPIPGLQVRTPANTWLDVKYLRGAIVVNTGEWLNRLTGGRFLATPHRVTAPREDRISMPVFINPNDGATDDPVPGSLAPGESAKHLRKHWHEFFLSYIDGYTKHIGQA